MDKISSTTSILFQIILTYIVLLVIYIIYAVLDIVEIDVIAEIGFLIFQPILGFALTSLTIIACLVTGLPIRLQKNVRAFWLSKPLIPLIGTAIGLFVLLLSFNNNFSELKEVTLDHGIVEKEVPNMTLALIGWFMTAFSLLHLYPLCLLRFIRSKRTKNNIGQLNI